MFNLYSQARRPLRVTTPLGPDAVFAVGLEGREALNELFSFRLELLVPTTTTIEFDKLLGQPIGVELRLDSGLVRYFNGIVSSLTAGRSEEAFRHFEALIVPRLWLRTLNVQNRIFQQQNVPDILRVVLDGLDVDWRLAGQYHPRDYCVQYAESDFAFASRLMEEEGITYFFEHRDDGHTLVLCDTPERLTDVAEPSTIVFEEIEGGVRPDPRITLWRKTQDVMPWKVTLWDRTFELPQQNLAAEVSLPDAVEVGTVSHTLATGNESLELYSFPGGYAKDFDGVDPGGGDRSSDLEGIFTDNERIANIRLQAEAAARLRLHGTSNCAHFTPGYWFSLVRHVDGDGKYLLAAVEHVARLNIEYRSGPDREALDYHNQLECLPEKLPYRPRRVTPRPTIAGLQVAVVTGPPGKEVFVDKYGRIKLQFAWDRHGQHDANSSCWVRVGQVWAGNRWGAFFWPRIGHEVLVAFAEGDPDQPIVVGSVYNAANMPPYTLPDVVSACGFKSCSYQGDPSQNYNSVVFHDAKGAEHLQLHSETHEHLTSETSCYRRTPGTTHHMLGSLPFPLSSGGGGGLLDFPTAAGVFNTDCPELEAFLHQMPGKYSIISGDQVGVNFGARYAHCFGPDLRMVADIEQLLLEGFMPGGILGSLLLGFGGSVLLVAGSNKSCTYGEKLDVRRGEGTTVTEDYFLAIDPESDALARAIKRVIQALLLVIVLFDLVMNLVVRIKWQPSPTQDPHGEDVDKMSFMLTFFYSRLVALLLELENVYAGVLKGEYDTVRAEDCLASSLILGFRGEETGTTWARGSLSRAGRRVTDVFNAIRGTLETEPAPEAPPPPADMRTICRGHYKIKARDIELLSKDASGPTNINIKARGGAVEGGTATIAGTKCGMLKSGNASLRVVAGTGTRSYLTADAGLLGLLKLICGTPIVGPQVVMSGEDNTITLQIGAPPAGPKIAMSFVEGIKLTYGLCTINMNEEGITLSVGPSAISITPEGVSLTGLKISNEAALQLVVQAVEYSEQVGGMREVQAPMTQEE